MLKTNSLTRGAVVFNKIFPCGMGQKLSLSVETPHIKTVTNEAIWNF